MEKIEIDELLIVRFLSGKTDSEESEKIIEWLNQGHQNRLHYFNLKRIWQESSVNPKNEDFLNSSWERLKFRMESTGNEFLMIRKKPELRWNLKKIAVAASFAVLIATSLFFGVQNYRISLSQENVMQIFVPFGSRSNLILPDGSNVWLNSGSTISYHSDFRGTGREVSLEGEGFFDVKNINNTPFTVSAGGLEIKVLGTSFNVKSYPDEKIVETTLVEGKVEVNTVKDSNLNSPIIMTPNQKLTYVKREGSMKLSSGDLDEGLKQESPNLQSSVTEDLNNFKIATKINPEIFTSWKDGKMIIDGETLEHLVTKLERFYNVRITLQDESMKSFKYSGTLEEVTIEEVLRAIASTSPIRFEINKNQIILKMSKK